MIEEMFEKLYRYSNIYIQGQQFKNGLKLLTEILETKFASGNDVRSYLTDLHTLPQDELEMLEKVFKRVILTQDKDKINWDGIAFQNRILPSGNTVFSAANYFLANINTKFTPEYIIKILQFTYAKNEIMGVFIIKTTPEYIEFFKKLYDSLINTEDSITLDEYEQNIETIVREANPNNFLLIYYGKTEYSSGFSLYLQITGPNLVIYIQHEKFEQIALFKIAVDSANLKPVSKIANSDGVQPFYTNCNGELFFVEAYRLRSELVKTAQPLQVQGGQQKRRTKKTTVRKIKYTKKRRSRK